MRIRRRCTDLPLSWIDLSAIAEGLLVRDGDCVLVLRGSERLVPIWPSGTRIGRTEVRLPGPNGGAVLRFGRTVQLQGGKGVDGDRTMANFGQVQRCAGSGFLLNRAAELPGGSGR
jgi:hypothetical protein